MSYIKRDNIPVLAGELAVELDTGDIVAVACNRKRVDYGVCYHATARAIEADGTARAYPNGSPLATSLKHSVSVERVDVLTDDAIARECMFAALGEPLQGLFGWPDVNLSAWSIRVSIAASQVSGDADAGAVL